MIGSRISAAVFLAALVVASVAFAQSSPWDGPWGGSGGGGSGGGGGGDASTLGGLAKTAFCQITGGANCEMSGDTIYDEMATPAAPAANKVRWFARDNGLSSPNNRTQICVEFSDGAVVVVAEGNAS